MQDSAKLLWLEKRRKCITGTDISAIIGLNQYASPMTVFLDKIGLSQPVVENEPMKWGKLLEPVIARRYAEENGVPIVQGEFMVKDGIIGGTPDYLTDNKLIEIKTAGHYLAKFWGEPGTDQIPEAYLCQVQWYMNLTDMEKCDIAVLIGGQDYRVYHAHRNQQFINLLIDAANDFWNRHVVPEIPPPLDASTGATAYLQEFFPRSMGNIIKANDDVVDVASELHKVRSHLAQLENRKLELENKIKFEIGTNDGIESGAFRATWRSTKDGEKIDYPELVKSLNIAPDLIKEFTKKTAGFRRFMFTYNV